MAFGPFDRQWIIPDNRVINRPNPELWGSRSTQQIYLTAPSDRSPTNGPGAYHFCIDSGFASLQRKRRSRFSRSGATRKLPSPTRRHSLLAFPDAEVRQQGERGGPLRLHCRNSGTPGLHRTFFTMISRHRACESPSPRMRPSSRKRPNSGAAPSGSTPLASE